MVVIIIIMLILFLIILKIGLNIKLKDLKRIKEIGYDKNLNNITNKLPKNSEVCKEILKNIDNSQVIVEENEDEKSKTSLYLVMQNKIIIANIDDTFTRIQTIAHECIHSLQDKAILKFNFIFSNMNILYFIIICILAILKIISNNTVFILTLLGYFLLGIVQFIVRNYLEVDAMTKARYLAKEYINNVNTLSQEEENLIISKYDEINSVGIKFYSFILVAKMVIKALFFCMIYLV